MMIMINDDDGDDCYSHCYHDADYYSDKYGGFLK